MGFAIKFYLSFDIHWGSLEFPYRQRINIRIEPEKSSRSHQVKLSWERRQRTVQRKATQLFLELKWIMLKATNKYQQKDGSWIRTKCNHASCVQNAWVATKTLWRCQPFIITLYCYVTQVTQLRFLFSSSLIIFIFHIYIHIKLFVHKIPSAKNYSDL